MDDTTTSAERAWARAVLAWLNVRIKCQTDDWCEICDAPEAHAIPDPCQGCPHPCEAFDAVGVAEDALAAAADD